MQVDKNLPGRLICNDNSKRLIFSGTVSEACSGRVALPWRGVSSRHLHAVCHCLAPPPQHHTITSLPTYRCRTNPNMVQTISKSILLVLGLQLANTAHGSSNAQVPLRAPGGQHHVDQAILSALKQFPDPVDALTFLNPEMAAKLAEPRLLRIAGEHEPRMLTEGDKMRLRRNHTKFADITDFQDLYTDNVSVMAGKAHLPEFTHQRLIKPLFPQISTTEMHDSLKTLSSFYTRYSHSITGEQSAVWLHDQIADIIKNAPFHTRISLSYFTHDFAQPSIIARFETKVADASLPLTILGGHQDSMNYLFPLLPAPGADDDGSGTITILEAFKVLANSGYIPERGPVEFHWYAAEEDGLLGSQAVAKFKKESNATIGAMMEFVSRRV